MKQMGVRENCKETTVMDEFTKELELAMDNVFDRDGLLSASLKQYEYRPQQGKMAKGVAQALILGRVLAVEAPTGVGKSFAYLVPLMIQRQKAVVATLTKALMHQLFDKDIPFLIEKLGLHDLDVALLKGRTNYLCLARLKDERRMGSSLFVEPAKLAHLFKWARTTTTGDFVETGLAQDDSTQREFSSSPETCPGRACRQYSQCWYFKTLKAAQEADLVVTNQHLLCASLAAGAPFPSPQATIVIDEAHSLDDVARNSFGQEVAAGALRGFVREAELMVSKSGDPEARAIHKLINGLVDRFTGIGMSMLHGTTSLRLARPEQVNEQDRAGIKALKETFKSITTMAKALEKRDITPAISDWAQELQSTVAVFLDFTDPNLVHILERDRRGITMSTLPIMVGEYLQEHMYPVFPAMILTSATLTVEGRLKFLREKLGLPANTDLLTLQSPFDLAKQSILFVPAGFPEPNRPDFIDRLADLALKAITEAGGKTFLLFTSHRNLQQVYERLEPLLSVPILKQGDGPKEKLINKFKELGNAVLFGSMTFWQGVDVMGPSLSMVLIDKLPFPSPANPIVEARSALMASQGRRDFWEWSLPETAMILKQGFGRLIRSKTDTGVVMITDVRLLNRSYGRYFLRELPEIPLVTEENRLLEWIKNNVKD